MILLPALAAALLAAPALAEVETQSRPIPAFRAIHVSHGVELTVRRGDGPSLSITGERDELPEWRTEVRDGVLTIEPKSFRRGSRRGVSVALTATSLDALEASGGVRAVLEHGLGRRLAVEASGGVHLTARALELDVLELAASGGASLELAGSAAEVRAELSGGVDLDARRLVADRVKLEASGGVHLTARALELDVLELDASGGVTLELAGTAAEVRADVSGGVKLDARRLVAERVELEASGGCKLRLQARESVTGRASGGAGVEIHGRPREALVNTSGGSSLRYRD